MKRKLGAALLLGLLVGAVGLAAWVARTPRSTAFDHPPAKVIPGKTNLVLVIACTLRADQTTPYGGPSTTTPFLDEIARSGTRFADTIAQAPWTKPAITAILTGRHAIQVGMVQDTPNSFDDKALPDGVTTLAEHFHEAGYRTLGAVGNPNANSVFGFGQGFDSYYQPTDLWAHGTIKVDGDLLVGQMLDELDHGSGPFYLELLLVDAHFPKPPGTDATAFRSEAPTARVAQYRAMLKDLDDAIRGLDDGLRARGHDENDTVFVVIGDHGEGLYFPHSHGKSHGWYLYPANVHVPWVMRGPGVAQANVVEGLSRQLDVVPTLLDLLRLPADDAAPGRDLAALVGGAPGPTGIDRAEVDTWFREASRAAIYTPSRFCQKDYAPEASASREARAASVGKARTTPPFPTACFDWRTDPQAEVPVDDAALMEELDRWRSDRLLELHSFREATPGRTGVIDEGIENALQGLGYLE